MSNSISNEWKCRDIFTDLGDKYYINGLNIWDYKWIYLEEYVNVRHPIYKNQEYNNVNICCIIEGSEKIFFLAVEFSSNVWGIYLKDDYKTKLIKFA